MTQLEQTPNPAFWQALENYIRGRIVEKVTTLTPGIYQIAGAMFTAEANGDYVHWDTGEVITDTVNQIRREGFTPERVIIVA